MRAAERAPFPGRSPPWVGGSDTPWRAAPPPRRRRAQWESTVGTACETGPRTHGTGSRKAHGMGRGRGHSGSVRFPRPVRAGTPLWGSHDRMMVPRLCFGVRGFSRGAASCPLSLAGNHGRSARQCPQPIGYRDTRTGKYRKQHTEIGSVFGTRRITALAEEMVDGISVVHEVVLRSDTLRTR